MLNDTLRRAAEEVLAATGDRPPEGSEPTTAEVEGWYIANDGRIIRALAALRAALIEGSDPAGRSWPGRAEMEAMTNAEVNAFLESRGLGVRLIEGSDPASPPCKECGEAQAAPQHDPETILDPGTVGHEVHVYFPVREGSDPASPETPE